MTAPKREFHPRAETEIRVLFDLRVAGSAEQFHRERAAWQEHSEIEALDEHHFILIIRAGRCARLAA
jgi:hypothetical protein